MFMNDVENKLRRRPHHWWLRAGLGLSAVLLLGLAPPAQGQPAPTDESADPARRADRPLELPDSLQRPVNLRRGIQFGIGTHNITVTSEP